MLAAATSLGWFGCGGHESLAASTNLVWFVAGTTRPRQPHFGLVGRRAESPASRSRQASQRSLPPGSPNGRGVRSTPLTWFGDGGLGWAGLCGAAGLAGTHLCVGPNSERWLPQAKSWLVHILNKPFRLSLARFTRLIKRVESTTAVYPPHTLLTAPAPVRSGGPFAQSRNFPSTCSSFHFSMGTSQQPIQRETGNWRCATRFTRRSHSRVEHIKISLT